VDAGGGFQNYRFWRGMRFRQNGFIERAEAVWELFGELLIEGATAFVEHEKLTRLFEGVSQILRFDKP